MLKYINQIGMKNRCAIVDIGWKGSMQFYLETFLKLHHVNAELVGYYVGIKPIDGINGRTNGYLFCKDNMKLRKSVLCFFGGYEKLFQSLEGSTHGYIIKNKVLPVLNEYEYDNDLQMKNNICGLQCGAIDYIRENININTDNKKLAEKLVFFGKYPSMNGIRLFHSFYNTDGIKEYYVSQKPLYKYTYDEFRHALSNSVWKTGFLKSVFVIPFPYFWIYRLMKK